METARVARCCKRKKPAVLHHGLNYILTQASVSSETLAFACGFVSSRHAEAPFRELRSQTVSQLLVNIFYFTTVSLRVSTIEKS